MVKRAFAEVIKIRMRMRSSWVRVALNPMTGVLITDRRAETQTQRSPRERRGRFRMWPRAKGSLEPKIKKKKNVKS